MPTVFNLTDHGFLVAKLPRESEQFQQAARDPPKTSFFNYQTYRLLPLKS